MPMKAAAMPRDLNTGPVAERVAALNARYRHHSATAVLEHSLRDDDLGRVALVSSFGAESVVLLHLVSVIAPETPVLFIDTRMLFPETLDYQREVAEKLHLCDIRTIRAGQFGNQAACGVLLHRFQPANLADDIGGDPGIRADRLHLRQQHVIAICGQVRPDEIGIRILHGPHFPVKFGPAGDDIMRHPA